MSSLYAKKNYNSVESSSFKSYALRILVSGSLDHLIRPFLAPLLLVFFPYSSVYSKLMFFLFSCVTESGPSKNKMFFRCWSKSY